MDDLFQTYFSEDNLYERVILDRNHSVSDGLNFELRFGSFREYEFFQSFRHFQYFEESGASFMSFVIAFRTPALARPVKSDVVLVRYVFANASEDLRFDLFIRNVSDLAMRTQLSRESLRYDHFETGDDEERIDSEIDETLDGVDRRIGVDRGEHEMSGDGSFDCEVGRFRVADFPDHDDIRILSEEAAESVREVESDLGTDLRMVDSFHPVLDGILQGGNVFFLRIEGGNHRVERRGFS